MAIVTVTTSATTILDGTQVADTMVTVGAVPIRIATGSAVGRTFDNSTPIDRGQIIVFPAGTIVTGFVGTGSISAPVYVESFA